MESYICPLCKQDVSKSIFEKITGIWDEKEKRLQAIKNKEKDLKKREQNLIKKFKDDKKKLAEGMDAKFKASLDLKIKAVQKSAQKEQEKLKKEKSVLEKTFKNTLAAETNRLLNLEKVKQKHLMSDLQVRFEKQAAQKIEKSNQALQKDKNRFEREKKVQANKYDQLNRQFSALQNKNVEEIRKREAKIQQLQEQLRKNKTPSELGFANEKDMLEALQDKFPFDRFEHTGKGGDIVHYIKDGGKEVGIIVYELKRVSNFSNSHIQQTLAAKQTRNADYAVLVTNAKRSKNDFGFSVTKGVVIIHPAGAMTIIAILREQLITISKLKLSNKQRDEATRAVLDYIHSPAFKNSIESIIDNTIELYDSMKKEVKDHISIWKDRLNKYNDINVKAVAIESRVVKLIAPTGETRKRLVKDSRISPIELPAEIK
ncbi:MAG TPA: DUF2130 domain-containing protein [Anaerolineales bacterium]|nr:DUF2130 domain-containing protein [Anaerolineales bacterium]